MNCGAYIFALSLCGCAATGATDADAGTAVTSAGGEATHTVQAADDEAADRQRRTEALAIASGHRSFEGRTLIALAEARVGTRTAWIVWPAFGADGGRPVSDDTMGVTLDVTPEGTLTVINAGWNPRDRTGRALAAALGAERFERVDRAQGAPLDELPARITEAFEDFRAACSVRDRPRATRAAQRMAGLFAWEVVAYEDVVTEMLWAASTGDYELSHGSTTLLDGGARARITAIVTYRGRPHTIAVIAVPRRDGSGRWIITSEESE
jgi:hypothetical protein